MSDPAFTQVRYPSLNNNFTVNTNVPVNMQVPAEVGVADLTKSKFIFDMKLKAQNAAGAEVLYPVTFGKRGQKVGPECLIRQTQVQSNSGVFFERNNINVVSQLYNLTKSRGEDDDASFFGNTVGRNFGYSKSNLMPDTPFLVYDTPSSSNATITASATSRNAEVPLPWHVVDPQGKMSQYPFLASGKTDYTMDLVTHLDPAGIALAEMPVNVATLNNVTAVGGFIGIAAAPLVTQREVANFENPILVGQIIHVIGNQNTSGVPTATIDSFVEVETVAVVGNQYSITVVGGIATASATEVINGASMYWGARIDVRQGAYKVDDFAAPFAGLQDLGTALKPLTFTDFYLQYAKTDFNLCPFYVGAPIFYRGIQPIASAATLSAIVAGGTGYANANDVPTTSAGGGTGLTVDITAAAGAVTAAVINQAGKGYTVGDVITITGGNADATFTIATITADSIQFQSYATVTSMTRAGNDLQIVVSQEDPITLDNLAKDCLNVYASFADHSYVGVKFTPVWSISRVIPQLHKLTLSPDDYAMMMKSLSQGYNAYVLTEYVQRVSKEQGDHISTTVQIPRLCVAASVLTPENTNLLSSFSNATSYSYTWDDKYPFIPSDIPVGSGQTAGRKLYNYLLKKYYSDIGEVLKQYDGPYLDYDANGGYLSTNAIFPMISPYIPSQQTLNFVFKSTNDMSAKQYYIVSHHTQELQISQRGITMM